MKRKPLVSDLKANEVPIRQGILYARVSSGPQEREGFSIPAQLKFLREYAADHQIEVLKEFIDVDSAKVTGRPEYSKMLAYLRKNTSVRIVLTEKVDRLYRNGEDELDLAKLDIDIHFVKENRVHSRRVRASEKFLHKIRVAVAENHSDNLSEETIKGMQEKAEEGMWPSVAPIGYINIELESGKRGIVPDPERTGFVRHCFELYATGNYSMKQLAKWAREVGLTFRKSGRPVNKATLQVILHNPIYYGEFDWNGKHYVGKYQPIVSRELWERVQSIATSRLTYRHRVIKHDLAFAGLIRCGHCGCALVGEIKKGKYIYYHCTGQREECKEKRWAREEAIELQFTEIVWKITLPPMLVDWAASALAKTQVDERKLQSEAAKRLKSEHSRLQKNLDTMYQDRLIGRITGEEYDRQSASGRSELGQLERRLKDLEATTSQTHVRAGIELLKLAENAGKLFKMQPAREKRRLLKFVVSNSSWKDGKLTVQYRQPFDLFSTWEETMKKGPITERLEKGQNENWLLR